MTTIHIITNQDERELVKRIFRGLVNDVYDASVDINNMVNGDMCYCDNGSLDIIFGDGAIVYDILNGGDPELGWMVYDFRENGRCYAIDEQDIAGLVNELPPRVFPF